MKDPRSFAPRVLPLDSEVLSRSAGTRSGTRLGTTQNGGNFQLRRQDSNPPDASSGSERERVAATENGRLQSPHSGAPESKTIETQTACTNVPNASIAVAEALAVLRAASLCTDQARTIRRALIGLLAALKTEE
jgi:hypothetical protein